jgi:hypothetical protein
MLSEEAELRLEDLHMSILLTLDLKKREMLIHGLDIMLNHNSVLMEMPPTSKILANVTEQSGSEEDRTKPKLEFLPGINSDCGHLFQRPMNLYTLDVTNILSVMPQASKAN